MCITRIDIKRITKAVTLICNCVAWRNFVLRVKIRFQKKRKLLIISYIHHISVVDNKDLLKAVDKREKINVE